MNDELRKVLLENKLFKVTHGGGGEYDYSVHPHKNFLINIIIDKEVQNFVMIKKMAKENWAPGKLLFVSGCIENGETVEEAAIRECKEETGYTPITTEILANFCNGPNWIKNRMYVTCSVVDTSIQSDDLSEEDKRRGVIVVSEPIDGFVSSGKFKDIDEYAASIAAFHKVMMKLGLINRVYALIK